MRHSIVGLHPTAPAFNSLWEEEARKSLNQMVEKQYGCNSDAYSNCQQAEDSRSQFLWNHQLNETMTFLIQDKF